MSIGKLLLAVFGFHSFFYPLPEYQVCNLKHILHSLKKAKHSTKNIDKVALRSWLNSSLTSFLFNIQLGEENLKGCSVTLAGKIAFVWGLCPLMQLFLHFSHLILFLLSVIVTLS